MGPSAKNLHHVARTYLTPGRYDSRGLDLLYRVDWGYEKQITHYCETEAIPKFRKDPELARQLVELPKTKLIALRAEDVPRAWWPQPVHSDELMVALLAMTNASFFNPHGPIVLSEVRMERHLILAKPYRFHETT
jgi:hypothetical protein